MNWKHELDALIESTMAFANDVKRRHPIPDLPIAMRTAEQALADTSIPIQPPITITPAHQALPIDAPSFDLWPVSESDEIRQRVSNFKAHQEKMAREREDYYSQVKAKMLAPVDPAFVQLRKNPPA
jgi:hypothetical protein